MNYKEIAKNIANKYTPYIGTDDSRLVEEVINELARDIEYAMKDAVIDEMRGIAREPDGYNGPQ